MLHDIHSYGFHIYAINGGKFLPSARFAIAVPDGGEDDFYLECSTMQEAELELREIVEFTVAENC